MIHVVIVNGLGQYVAELYGHLHLIVKTCKEVYPGCKIQVVHR